MGLCCHSIYKRWSVFATVLTYISFVMFVWTRVLPLRPYKRLNNQQRKDLNAVIKDLPDHLDGVRIERDGEINKNFRKEVILGEGEFEQRKEEDPKELLEDIFVRADTNNDSFLVHSELSRWIEAKIKQHIAQAHAENYILFASVDINPRNGLVSWEEYHQYFLRQKGYSKTYVENHDKRHSGLDRKTKETIMRDKAAWSEASHLNPNHLTVDEFLAFRHPESSHATILTLVEELFDKFDQNGDQILTEDEFSHLLLEGDAEKSGETINQGEAERRAEFRAEIDKNKDGKADRHELLMYIDPINPRHAREEAETLIALADVNHDGALSLLEVINKMDLFLGSKMVDTAKSFHDEF
ncbi:hypothetical protein FOCC_FOCC013911 [Frankliniella occidentalis]|uniref:45 kDa calcium-binding protein n=1 Tax=Frankliniella occidentalis TaxID=133901 RepID=A0A6J1SVE1_FRAOC|nr:45 kDa calcium-binding protein [Frankliniella occidentalis]KAE8740577.1 hypothetical protein FOCC_FOCC013911 [Frankliniella occidentalis]